MAEKIKASFRVAKGNPSHNDNTLLNERSKDVVEPEKTIQNLNMALTPEGKTITVPNGKGLLYKYEMQQCEKYLRSGLDKRNKKYESKGKKNSIKTMDEYREKNMDEAIFQIGDKVARENGIVKDEDLRNIVPQIANTLQQENKNAQVRITSISVHVDETSVHAHVRYMMMDKDKDGMWEVNKKGCLNALGYKPDKTYEESTLEERKELNNGKTEATKTQWERYHNEMAAWTDQVREKWYDALEGAGFDIDRETDPKNRSVRNKSVQQYKQEQLAEKNKVLKEDNNTLKDDNNDLKEENEVLERTNQDTLDQGMEMLHDIQANGKIVASLTSEIGKMAMSTMDPETRQAMELMKIFLQVEIALIEQINKKIEKMYQTHQRRELYKSLTQEDRAKSTYGVFYNATKESLSRMGISITPEIDQAIKNQAKGVITQVEALTEIGDIQCKGDLVKTALECSKSFVMTKGLQIHKEQQIEPSKGQIQRMEGMTAKAILKTMSIPDMEEDYERD